MVLKELIAHMVVAVVFRIVTTKRIKRMSENEQVLVFPAELLEGMKFYNSVIKGNNATIHLDYLMHSKKLHYMDRKEAEVNPAFKQIIPYCVLSCDDKIFVYQRTKKGGDSRLHDLYSIGVGGHINPED